MTWSDPAYSDLQIGEFGAGEWSLAHVADIIVDSVGTAKRHLFAEIAELFSVSAASRKQVTSNHPGSLTVADSMTRSWASIFGIEESIQFDDTAARHIEKNRQEYLAVRSLNNKKVAKNSADSISIATELSRRAKFTAHIAEIIAVADSSQKHSFREFIDSFSVWGAIVRSDGLAISDMLLSAKSVGLEEFKQMLAFGNIPGYSDWRDFIAGDYDYKKAVFRASLTSNNSDRGLLTNIQAVVDVPDIDDRGSATVQLASIGVRVNFSREYHVIPEVYLTTKGGMGEEIIIPFVQDVDLLGFTAFMKRQTGELVEGVFSWSAKGI
ncbi:hypothetical protein [Castellaniella sp.]|uniref:hypothetical protein n=1 Tax=Castellaniella sp. TaxID=1955812 RepID=UPI002AFE2C5C|nr:hypothetical protein [Castellaniella sp.]